MTDIFGRIVSLTIAVFSALSIILLTMTSIMDNIAQDVVDLRTNQFVDSVRTNGYMSQEMYLAYVNQLQATGNLYDIEMTHEHLTFVPVYSDDGVFLNDYQTAYENTYEADIMEEIMADGMYEFSKGDYFYVKVSSKNVTIGGRVRSLLIGVLSKAGTITTYYGGVIRNEFF